MKNFNNTIIYNMTRQFLSILLITVMITSNLFGQTDSTSKKNEVGFGLGLYQASMKNVLVWELLHCGAEFPSFQVYFRRSGLKNFHNVQVTYSNLRLYSPFKQNFTKDLRPTLSYTYLRKLSKPYKPISYYLGTSFFAYASFRDVRFNNEDIANNYNTEYTSMVSLSAMTQYKLGKNQFEAQLNFGVLSFNRRTGYANRVVKETNWQLQTLPDFMQYSLRIAYTRNLAKRFNIRIEYAYQFHSFKTPEYLGYSNNLLFVSTNFKF